MGAGDFRERSTSGGDQWSGARHSFDGGQRETFVQRWHAGELRLGVELDDALIADATHELHDVLKAELSKGCFGLRALLHLADNDEFDVALGSNLGCCFEQEHKALHRNVGACRSDDASRHFRNVWHRAKQFGVDANWHHMDLVGIDLVA